MNNDSLRETISRIKKLILIRIIIVSFLLGLEVFIKIKGTESILPIAPYSIYSIAGITYLLSIVYSIFLKKIKNILINIHVQGLVDVILVTALVYVTGGIQSIYSVLFPLVIIYSVLFLGKKGGLLVASACSIYYGFLLDLEYFGMIYPINNAVSKYEFSGEYVFSRIFIHIASFYIIAFLANFAVAREKKARELLSERESAFGQLDLLYKSIIESVNSGIITLDLERKITSFNRAAEKITGFSANQVMNRYVDKVLPGLSETLDKRGKDGEIETQSRVEISFPSKEGKNLILGFSFSPLKDDRDENVGDILIFQDLTSIKEMEKEMEKSKRLALIGEMSAVLAHEVRNPLTSISGSVQLLNKDLELNGTNQKLMQIIMRGKDQLENLTRDFLILAKTTMDNRSLLNVAHIIDDILESIRFGSDWNDNIEIIKNVCHEHELYGNRTEIRQVLWNIILNALQSMPYGGNLTIDTGVVTNGANSNNLEIRISDTGYGIEKERQIKVLEPFYTTKEKGTGLGLAIVNKIIDSHGGKFFLESELNKGTTCALLLPLNESLKK